MAKNYFSDNDLCDALIKCGFKYLLTDDVEKYKALMNLAVEAAIGEVVAYKFEYLFEQATEKGELDVWTEAVSRSYPKDMNGNHPVRNVSPLYLIQELECN